MSCTMHMTHLVGWIKGVMCNADHNTRTNVIFLLMVEGFEPKAPNMFEGKFCPKEQLSWNECCKDNYK